MVTGKLSCQNHLDTVRKENKGLSNEIKDIMDQIGEGGRNIHEIDKIRCERDVIFREMECRQIYLHS